MSDKARTGKRGRLLARRWMLTKNGRLWLASWDPVIEASRARIVKRIDMLVEHHPEIEPVYVEIRVAEPPNDT